MPNRVPRANGAEAMRAAARKYDLQLRASSAGYYDATSRRSGRKYSIKSALYERANEEPGVYRVWHHNLTALRRVQGSVVLVVVNPANEHRQVLKVTKRSPARLLDVGEFRRSEQRRMRGKREARIPWRRVMTL